MSGLETRVRSIAKYYRSSELFDCANCARSNDSRGSVSSAAVRWTPSCSCFSTYGAESSYNIVRAGESCFLLMLRFGTRSVAPRCVAGGSLQSSTRTFVRWLVASRKLGHPRAEGIAIALHLLPVGQISKTRFAAKSVEDADSG